VKKRQKKETRNPVTSIAFELIVMVLIGAFGGYQLDQYLGFEFPAFTIGLTIGLLILGLIRMVRKIS
jgi:F0F1-type ATP synthase assembly protein I